MQINGYTSQIENYKKILGEAEKNRLVAITKKEQFESQLEEVKKEYTALTTKPIEDIDSVIEEVTDELDKLFSQLEQIFAQEISAEQVNEAAGEVMV